MFVSRAAAGIAAAATALPRLDGLVFTGGIGEHSASMRSAIVRRLAPLGLGAVAATTVRNDAVISRSGVGGAVLRVEAREDAVIARQAAELLS
jgi:acetate kinase